MNSYVDSGISGFRGKNFSNESALSEFLKLVDNGNIQQGSVLIVENMDRLSRQSILPCLSKFIEIINKGIGIGVISQNKIFDTASVTNNPMELMLVLVEFARANSESATKSVRSKSVIAAKIERIKKGEKIWLNQRPTWIVEMKNNKFKIDEKKAGLVQGIFRRYLAGSSCNAIANELNKARTATLREFEGGIWTNSTIATILKNKNVIGWMKINGNEFDDFFPRIIDEKDFLVVQERLEFNTKTRGGSKYGLVRNIFKHLVYCQHCGQVVETKAGSYRNVKGGLNHYADYICRGVKHKNGCTNSGRMSVNDFEKFFFLSLLNELPENPPAKQIKDGKINDLELALMKVRRQINDATNLIGVLDMPQLRTKLEAFKNQETKFKSELENARKKQAVLEENPSNLQKLKSLFGIAHKSLDSLFDTIVGQVKEQVKDTTDTNKELNDLMVEYYEKQLDNDIEGLGEKIADNLKDTAFRKELKALIPSVVSKVEFDFRKRKSIVTMITGKQIGMRIPENYARL